MSLLYTREHLCLTNEGVISVYLETPVSDSWGYVYCILRNPCVRELRSLYCILGNTCVWQLMVSIVYTKEHLCPRVEESILYTREHLCLTVDGVYTVYQGIHVSDSWGCLHCILRNTCVWQLRVSLLYTKYTCVWQLRISEAHMSTTLFV